MTPDQLAEVEQIVNDKIWAALPVITVETDIETAKQMGPSLFTENMVKQFVLFKLDYSMELLWGTHANNTSDQLVQDYHESGLGRTCRIEPLLCSLKYLNDKGF